MQRTGFTKAEAKASRRRRGSRGCGSWSSGCSSSMILRLVACRILLCACAPAMPRSCMRCSSSVRICLCKYVLHAPNAIHARLRACMYFLQRCQDAHNNTPTCQSLSRDFVQPIFRLDRISNFFSKKLRKPFRDEISGLGQSIHVRTLMHAHVHTPRSFSTA